MRQNSRSTFREPDRTLEKPRDESRESGEHDLSPNEQMSCFFGEHPLRRIAADQENLIREVARLEVELQKAGEKADKEQKKLVMDLLEVMDAFDRLFRNLEERAATLEPQTKAVSGNFRIVRRLLSLALEQAGVTAIEAEPGSPVDPRLQEVVETRPTPGESDNLILEVIQAGYCLSGKILRYAKVVAGKNTEEESYGQGHRD